MSTLDLSSWLHFLMRLGSGICGILLVAFVFHWMCRSSSWRRVIWQVAILCSLILGLLELSGAGHGLGMWLFGKPKPERVVQVKILESVANEELSAPYRVPDFQTLPAPASIEVSNNCWWPGWLWLVGAGIVLARILLAHGLFQVFRLRRKRLTDTELVSVVRELSAEIGLNRSIAIYELQQINSPIAFGVLRPTIGVPESFVESFTPAQQRAMLTHELAHLRSRDPLWFLVANFVTALFWWHPGVWWMRRQLHVVSEFAADEAVALIKNGPVTLAECLVTFGHKLTERRPLESLGVGGFRSNLGKRVEALLELKRCPDAFRQVRRQVIARIVAPAGLIILLVCTVGWYENRDSEKAATFDGNVRSAWNRSFLAQTISAAQEERDLRALAEALRSEAARDIPSTESRDSIQNLFQRLEEVRVPELLFDRAPLEEAVQSLQRTAEPTGAFPVEIQLTNAVLVTLNSLTNLSLQNAIRAIIVGADQPITYEITANGVLVFKERSDQQVIYSEKFRLDLDAFHKELVAEGFKVYRQAFDDPGDLSTEPIPVWNITPGLAKYFTDKGVKLKTGTTFKISPADSTLEVKAEFEALLAMEKVIEPFKAEKPALAAGRTQRKLVSAIWKVNGPEFLRQVGAEEAVREHQAKLPTALRKGEIQTQSDPVYPIFLRYLKDHGVSIDLASDTVHFRWTKDEVLVRTTPENVQKLRSLIQPALAKGPPVETLVHSYMLRIHPDRIARIVSPDAPVGRGKELEEAVRKYLEARGIRFARSDVYLGDTGLLIFRGAEAQAQELEALLDVKAQLIPALVPGEIIDGSRERQEATTSLPGQRSELQIATFKVNAESLLERMRNEGISIEQGSEKFAVNVPRVIGDFPNIQRGPDLRAIEPQPSPTLRSPSGINFVTTTNSMRAINDAVRAYFSRKGVDLGATESLFFNERSGELIVRASYAKLKEVAALVAPFQASASGKLFDDGTRFAGSGEDNATTKTLPLPRVKLRTDESRTNDLPNALFEEAKQLFEGGRFLEAEANFRKILELEPDNKGAAYFLDLVNERNAAGREKSGSGLIHPTLPPKDAPRSRGVAQANPEDKVDPAELRTRSYKVNTAVMNANLLKLRDEIENGSGMNYNELGRELFRKAGVPIDSPKSLFYNDLTGSFVLRATESDFEALDVLVQFLNTPPPQVTISTKVVELPNHAMRLPEVAALFDQWNEQAMTSHSRATNNSIATNLVASTRSGTLNESQLNAVLKQLEKVNGFSSIGAPKVTTLSGRQAQVSITDMRTLVTGVDKVQGPDGTTTSTFKTEAVPFGPVVDLIPYVEANNKTVQMTVVATVNEFVEYEKADPALQKAVPGVAVPLPLINMRQVVATASITDGETLVLAGFAAEPDAKTASRLAQTGNARGALTPVRKAPRKGKHLLIFVTPTITDATGRRVNR